MDPSVVRDRQSEALCTFLQTHGNAVRDELGRTLLHEIAAVGWVEGGRILLQHGALIDARDNALRTPLHEACLKGQEAVVVLLVEHGGDVNAETVDGLNALQLAVCMSRVPIVTYLLHLHPEVDVNHQTKIGQTAVHLAASAGDLCVARLLLTEGCADVSICDIFGRTALHHAAREGFADLIHLLLESGSSINAMDMNQCTPLHFASSQGKSDTILLLLEHGAAVNQPTSLGYTPLHNAAFGKHVEAVVTLLQRGADPTLRSYGVDGKTPVEVAKGAIRSYLEKYGSFLQGI